MENETNEERLVRRVNELFHDYSKEEYENVTHVEMINKEKERWERLREYFEKDYPLVIADIGSGGGFVPLTISRYLKKQDKVICTDVSQEMLNNLKINLAKKKFKCRFKFLKIKDKTLPLKDNSANIITVNSVLHHIADTKFFLKEIDRILKEGGILIIGHEPNIRFRHNKYLINRSRLLRYLLKPKEEIKYFSIKFGVYKILNRIFGFVNPRRKIIIIKRDRISQKISSILKKENLIDKDLAITKVMSLVDYKTAGFDPINLMRGYKILHLETYNHLKGLDDKDIRFIKNYAAEIKKNYPFDGRTFLAVYEK